MATRSSAGSRDGARPGMIGLMRPLAYALACFFIWGLSYGLLDVLNKHFQDTLHIGKAESTWLQIAYFGAFLVMSLPAGSLMQWRGYQFSLVFGLCVTALGALLFIPAAYALSFPAFVAAMFVLASGLCCVETASETYVNCLGEPEQATQRLNLAQAFSGLGTVVGPFLGGAVFFSPLMTGLLGGPHVSIQMTYALIAAGVLAFAFALGRAKLPPANDMEEDEDQAPAPPLYRQRHFILAVATQAIYVSAQVSTGAFFINLAVETWPGFTAQNAAFLLSAASLVYMGGRFINTLVLSYMAPRTMLMVYAAIAATLLAITSMGLPRLSALTLAACFFFMAPMFGTIFGLGGAGLGRHTKRGFSIMVMAIGGGILLVYPMGLIAEAYGTARAYILPVFSMVAVFLYAWKGSRIVPVTR